MSHFGLSVQSITAFHDTSRGDDDRRLNYVLDNKYVLKINSSSVMSEQRLREIHRLIKRYHSIGVYCPDLIPTLNGRLFFDDKLVINEEPCFHSFYSFGTVACACIDPSQRQKRRSRGHRATRDFVRKFTPSDKASDTEAAEQCFEPIFAQVMI